MKILLAGGCFRLSQHELANRQPPPEVNLARGLEALGHEVMTRPLEDLRSVLRPPGVDIVHVHHLSKAAVAGVLQRSVPTVYTAHSAEAPRKWSHRRGLAVVRRHMQAGVCLSRSELDGQLAEAPWAADRLHIIPNGMNYPHPREIVGKQSSTELKLLFVGQLIDVKRVDWIIRAMVRMPHATLRVVFHNDLNRRSLTRLAAELGVTDRLEFVGQRAGTELYQEYYEADFLVLPSRSEAMPSVVVEALSAGLPVVASDVGAVRELVGDAGVVFDPCSYANYESALIQATAARDRLLEHARVRSAYIRREFSIDRMARRHEQLYELLLTSWS